MDPSARSADAGSDDIDPSTNTRSGRTTTTGMVSSRAKALRNATSEQWAAITFGVYLAVAALLLLLNLGRHLWFFHDEWIFLATRTDDGFLDAFQPHNEHWVTVPVLLYKALFALVGLHSYVPYQVPVVFAHLAVAALLRDVMRRAGVGPWIATVAAGTFVLFGWGERNIVGAFQIAFTGGLAFGLIHLLLTDHEGRTDRRDWIGLGAGAFALMFSGVGLAMVAVVGLAAWMRRGWRVALLHTVPLVGLFLAWYLINDPQGPRPEPVGPLVLTREIAEFTAAGLRQTFDAMGSLPWVGVALAILLAVGLVLAWLPLSWRQFRTQASLPLALLAGSVLFLALAGFGRWEGGWMAAGASRYLHLTAAFCLAALAVAADAVVRRWRWVTPAVVVLLLVGVPGNIAKFGDDGAKTAAFFDHSEQLFRGLAHAPEATIVTPRNVPYREEAGRATVAWLLERGASGDLRALESIDPAVAEEIRLRLGLFQQRAQVAVSACESVTTRVDLAPARGERFTFEGGQIIVTSLAGPPDPLPIIYDPLRGTTLRVELPDLRFRLAPRVRGETITLCR